MVRFVHQYVQAARSEPSGGCARRGRRCVKSVFVVHVGGTRCVTSSTANNMKIHARITLTVECIRTCIFLFLFLNTMTSMI